MHQIAQFEVQKCKSSLPWEGGHPPPPLGSFPPSGLVALLPRNIACSVFWLSNVGKYAVHCKCICAKSERMCQKLKLASKELNENRKVVVLIAVNSDRSRCSHLGGLVVWCLSSNQDRRFNSYLSLPVIFFTAAQTCTEHSVFIYVGIRAY